MQRLLAKQQELARKIKAVERKQAALSAAAVKRRQHKLGRLLEAWMVEDVQFGRQAAQRFGKERWSKEDGEWLQQFIGKGG